MATNVSPRRAAQAIIFALLTFGYLLIPYVFAVSHHTARILRICALPVILVFYFVLFRAMARVK